MASMAAYDPLFSNYYFYFSRESGAAMASAIALLGAPLPRAALEWERAGRNYPPGRLIPGGFEGAKRGRPLQLDNTQAPTGAMSTKSQQSSIHIYKEVYLCGLTPAGEGSCTIVDLHPREFQGKVQQTGHVRSPVPSQEREPQF